MAQRGVPMWDIAGYLGHSDSRTTERIYAPHSPEFLERAISKATAIVLAATILKGRSSMIFAPCFLANWVEIGNLCLKLVDVIESVIKAL